MQAAYHSTLLAVATLLNSSNNSHTALQQSLQTTVELLGLEGGWIWLLQKDQQSVYLAASHQLPKALAEHPERLSGWCYCIDKYLNGDLQEAGNISEISCTRLKDIVTASPTIKFHSSVPISIEGRKIGILNLLHKDSEQLDTQRLELLQKISELIAATLKRAHQASSYTDESSAQTNQASILDQKMQAQLSEWSYQLKQALEEKDINIKNKQIQSSLEAMQQMQAQLSLVKKELGQPNSHTTQNAQNNIRYPNSPLSKRELEVLEQVKKGFTNKQIAQQLFVSERTIKFHLSSILSKLSAQTRTEAVAIASQRGLIDNSYL